MARKVHRVMSDDMQDAEVTKGMSKAQFAAWKKADAAHDQKSMSAAQDAREDRVMARKIRRDVD